MEKIFDIVALGEMLIDFTPCGKSEQGHELLEANPGGAPCNMLAMAAKLGAKTAFIGKVGADSFGKMLKQAAENAGICTNGMVLDEKVFTTLAFVHLDQSGDRSFSFCRKPGADTCLRADELRRDIIQNAKIFHIGTLSMTDEPAKTATQEAVLLAKNSGAIISFDPNIRPLLWENIDRAKETMEWGFARCDILKISDDELKLATGVADNQLAIDKLLARYPNIHLAFVTMGKDGCLWRCGERSGTCASPEVRTIDTTGAGDTFMGCCLALVAQKELCNLTDREIADMVRFANAAAAIVTTRKGALQSMPKRDEVNQLLKDFNRN